MTTTLTGWISAFAHAWLVRALGWTLVHFCWQGALVAVVLWAALELLADKPARVRYGATLAALAMLVGLPCATLLQVGAAEYRLAAAQGLAEAPALVVHAGLGDAASPWLARAGSLLDPAVPWVMLAWMVGAAVFCFRLGVGFEVTRRMRRVGVWAVSDELQARFAGLAARLRVGPAVRLLHSALVEAPTVIGWLRPVVLLPVSCVTGLSEAQLETVLCHELAHVLRQDYLVSVVQGVVEALGFFHPGVWWISRQIRRERECCCDEIAVAVGGDRLAYARALTLLEAGRGAYPQVMLGANGGVLTMRIKRMLGASGSSAAGQAAAVAVLALLAVGAAVTGNAARAQSQTTQLSAVAAAPVLVGAKVAVKPTVAVRTRVSATAVTPVVIAPEAAAAPPQQQGPARLSGGVMAGQIVSKVNPVYPKEAREQHISGSVVMRAIISKTGDVANLQVVSGPPELMASALDAVRQWKYKPYLLNGEPTEVETTITVNYNIGGEPPAGAPPTSQLQMPDGGGSGVKAIGNGVSAPKFLSGPPPAYTSDARARKVNGSVVVGLVVDKDGLPSNVKVLRGLDSGLDEKAVEAVRQYRFAPAMEHGQPVPVELKIEVNFQVF